MRTCHQMYASPRDGLNHQANLTLALRQEDMTITDAEGNTVYDRESFLMDRKNDGYSTLKLDQEFADSADGLTAGQTYYCTLTALASNGTVSTIFNNKAFTVGEPAVE